MDNMIDKLRKNHMADIVDNIDIVVKKKYSSESK